VIGRWAPREEELGDVKCPEGSLLRVAERREACGLIAEEPSREKSLTLINHAQSRLGWENFEIKRTKNNQ
jgi:hypothetical protein